MAALSTIPTLDDVVRDVGRISGLNPLALAALAGQCAAVQAALAAELIRISTNPVGVPTTEDRLLTTEQLAKQLEVKASWVAVEARAGRIPRQMIGRYVRFDLAEVQEALRKRAAK